MPFKVIEVGTNVSFSPGYRSLLFKFWTLCGFECPFGAQGQRTYVTAEALRAKIDRISAILLKCGQFDPKFQVEGVASH